MAYGQNAPSYDPLRSNVNKLIIHFEFETTHDIKFDIIWKSFI